jgi:anti-anti-sigma factor
MEIQLNQLENGVVLKLSGRFDVTCEAAFDDAVSASLAESKGTIVVNLSAVEYVSSAGLRAILWAGKKVQAAERRIYFTTLSAQVRKVF